MNTRNSSKKQALIVSVYALMGVALLTVPLASARIESKSLVDIINKTANDLLGEGTDVIDNEKVFKGRQIARLDNCIDDASEFLQDTVNTLTEAKHPLRKAKRDIFKQIITQGHQAHDSLFTSIERFREYKKNKRIPVPEQQEKLEEINALQNRAAQSFAKLLSEKEALQDLQDTLEAMQWEKGLTQRKKTAVALKNELRSVFMVLVDKVLKIYSTLIGEARQQFIAGIQKTSSGEEDKIKYNITFKTGGTHTIHLPKN
jgi:hypothetical protein